MPSLALHIPTDHPAFAGHFPGQPLLPGVSLLAEVLEAVLDELLAYGNTTSSIVQSTPVPPRAPPLPG